MLQLAFLILFFVGGFFFLRFIYNWTLDNTEGGRSDQEVFFFDSKRNENPAPQAAAPVNDLSALPFDGTRCERCSAAPQIQFYNVKSKSVLEFCSHHGRQNRDKLAASGFSVSIDRAA